MKFGPRNLKFTFPVFSPLRRKMLFYPRGNTMHLQETALVVEGNLQRFRIPVFETFVRRALCDWSSVTIPYSRLRRFVYIRYVIPKTVIVLLMLGVLAFSGWLVAGRWLELYYVSLFDLLFGLLAFLFWRLFVSRHRLEYVQVDGKRCSLYFRLLGRQQRRNFTDLLNQNWKIAVR